MIGKALYKNQNFIIIIFITIMQLLKKRRHKSFAILWATYIRMSCMLN